MKIFYHSYELKPLGDLNAVTASRPRPGALLKIEWPNGKTGYADLHPWPELGDEALDAQLLRLKSLKLTPLSEQSIWFAKRDATARAENRSLWMTGVQLKNNETINDVTRLEIGFLDEVVNRGFTTVKVKCGRDLEAEAKLVNSIAGRQDLFVRMDFNGVGNAATFEKFMKLVNRESDGRIEYVEDPFAYDHEAWREVRKRWKIAIDFELARSPWMKGDRPMADVLVLKPARMDVDASVAKALAFGMNVTVTSSMDHAIGALHAHAVAQELKKKNDLSVLTAGCMTFRQYQMDAFSARVPLQGPFIGKPPGLGVGFDDLFQGLPWRAVTDL